MTGEISSVGDLLGPMLTKIGVAELSVLNELSERWDELAGPPWAGNSKPQVIQHAELVVAADSAAGVRVMRYATESLAKRLSTHFGQEVVSSVRVVAPVRSYRTGATKPPGQGKMGSF